MSFQKIYPEEPFSINPDAEDNDIPELLITTSLCQRCRQLPGLAFSGTFLANFGPRFIPVVEVCRGKEVLEMLRESGSRCQLCTLMLDAIHLGVTEERAQNSFQLANLVLFDGTRQKHNPKLVADAIYLLADFTNEFKRTGPAELNILRGRKLIGILPLTIGARSQWVRAVHVKSSSDPNFAMIRKWIDHCDKRHFADCGRAPRYIENFVVPTRLIDVAAVDESGSPRLVLGTNILKDADHRYTALSHRWGSESARLIPQTTKDNVDTRLSMIPWDSMPKTFQDAIVITRRIGVPYLWIDSLCILQDDEGDWERECALMGKIYTRSYLTIAASASEDSRGGCFVQDDPKRVRNCTWMPDGILVTVHPAIDSFDCRISGPLSSRGWTFQEYHLSPRILHFTKGRILWECRDFDGLAYENAPRMYKSENRLRPRLIRRMVREDCSDFGLYHFPGHIEMMRPFHDWERDWWYAAVRDYSGRQLTRKSDKLPALSGVAGAMHAYTQQWYLAGIWLLDIPAGLLWSPTDEMYKQPNQEQPLPWQREPLDPLLPYWSWAAFDGQVHYDFTRTFGPTYVRIQHVAVEPSNQDDDPFGRVRNAHIRIASRFAMKVTISEKDHVPGFVDKRRKEKYYSMYIQHLGSLRRFINRAWWAKRVTGIIWFDVDPFDLPETTFYCVALGETPSHFGSPDLYRDRIFDIGLVLIKTTNRCHDLSWLNLGRPQYRRVGLFEVASDCIFWTQSFSPTEVLLV